MYFPVQSGGLGDEVVHGRVAGWQILTGMPCSGKTRRPCTGCGLSQARGRERGCWQAWRLARAHGAGWWAEKGRVGESGQEKMRSLLSCSRRRKAEKRRSRRNGAKRRRIQSTRDHGVGVHAGRSRSSSGWDKPPEVQGKAAAVRGSW